MSSIWDTLVTGFDAVVTFSNSGTGIADAVNGAMFGAITTAIGGGDVLEGAAWGAAGNLIEGAGDEGIFNVLGRGVAGYGIDKALGGDGLIGGATGLLAGYDEGSVSRTAGNKTAPPAGSTPPAAPKTPSVTLPPSQSPGLLASLGLQTAAGDGTVLGKGLVSAIGAYGASDEREEMEEQVAELRDKSDRNKKLLDEEFQQRNLAGFKQPSMIVRNG